MPITSRPERCNGRAGDGARFDRETAAMPGCDRYPRQPLLASAHMRLSGRPLPHPWDGPEHCIQWTTSGRAAILVALRSAGIGRGHRVLVPTYHCPSMVAPIVALEATPVFYALTSDGAPDTSTFGVPGLRPAEAMIAPHFFGIPVNLRDVRALCDAHQMVLIEDCAHAFAGHTNACPVGTYGDFVVASLTKFFPTVEGGLLLSRRAARMRVCLKTPPLIDELRAAFDLVELWASYGDSSFARSMAPLLRLKRRLRNGRESGAIDTKPELDASFRADAAASGRTALRLTAWLVRHSDWPSIAAARRRNYALYSRLLSGCRRGHAPIASLPDDAAPYVFPFVLPRSEPVYQGLRAHGVPVFRWDRRWPGTPDLPGDVGAAWSAELLQLSCHQSLSEKHIGRICEIVIALADRQH
jgi:perosamine synthetase